VVHCVATPVERTNWEELVGAITCACCWPLWMKGVCSLDQWYLTPQVGFAQRSRGPPGSERGSEMLPPPLPYRERFAVYLFAVCLFGRPPFCCLLLFDQCPSALFFFDSDQLVFPIVNALLVELPEERSC
jgi:hypothetical protein